MSAKATHYIVLLVEVPATGETVAQARANARAISYRQASAYAELFPQAAVIVNGATQREVAETLAKNVG